MIQAVSVGTGSGKDRGATGLCPQPCFFLLFINYIPISISSGPIFLFADEMPFNISVKHRDNLDINSLIQGSSLLYWIEHYCLAVNIDKTKFIAFYMANSNNLNDNVVRFIVRDTEIQSSDCTDFLGLYTDSNLKYSITFTLTRFAGNQQWYEWY